MMTPIFLSFHNGLYQKLHEDFNGEGISNIVEKETLYVHVIYGTICFNLAEVRRYEDLIKAGYTEPDNDELLRLLRRKK